MCRCVGVSVCRYVCVSFCLPFHVSVGDLRRWRVAPLCPAATNASTKCGSRRRLLLFDPVPPTTTTTATTKRCYKLCTLLRKPLPSTCSCHPLHIFRDHLLNCTHSQMSFSRKKRVFETYSNGQNHLSLHHYPEPTI